MFWLKVQRRVAQMTPDVARAILAAFATIRLVLTSAEVAQLIAAARIDELIATVLSDTTLASAFLPVREELRSAIRDAAKAFALSVPADPLIPRTVLVAFDALSPRVIEGIRTLESRVVTTLEADVREVARAYIENGLRDGLGPRTIATGLRDVVGMAPNQEVWARNLRAELEAGDYAAASRRALLDSRYNLEKLADLSPADRAARIDTIVGSYRKRSIAFNAETNARTGALDAAKLGQRLAWDGAVARGDVDGNRLMKRWAGVMDSRERPEHVAMQGDVVPYDAPFSNGETIPGESTFNCRCIAVYFQSREAMAGVPVNLGPLALAGAAAAE